MHNRLQQQWQASIKTNMVLKAQSVNLNLITLTQQLTMLYVNIIQTVNACKTQGS